MWEVVDYREPVQARRIALWTVPLVAWFVVMLFLSVAVFDERIADGLFSWYPESVREFASLEGDSTYATWVLVVVFAAAFAINGILGPVVEELYFRGHLLPRIDRFGRGTGSERCALLPLPLLDAVAEHRSSPRAAPLDLHGLAEAQRGAVDGHSHLGELHLPAPRTRRRHR